MQSFMIMLLTIASATSELLQREYMLLFLFRTRFCYLHGAPIAVGYCNKKIISIFLATTISLASKKPQFTLNTKTRVLNAHHLTTIER